MEFQPEANFNKGPEVEITRMRPLPARELALALGRAAEQAGARLDGISSLYSSDGMLRRIPELEELQSLFAVGKLIRDLDEEMGSWPNSPQTANETTELFQGLRYLLSGDPSINFGQLCQGGRVVADFAEELPTFYEQLPQDPFREKALSYIQAANKAATELSEVTQESFGALARFLLVRMRACRVPDYLSPYSDRDVDAIAVSTELIKSWLSEEQRVEEAGGLSQGEFKALLQSGIEQYRRDVYPNLSYRGQVGRESEGVLLSATDSFIIARIARDAITASGEEGVVPELGAGQYELNFPVQTLGGRVFSDWLDFEERKLAAVEKAAQEFCRGVIPVPIAIAPTLTREDLQRVALGDGERWDRLDAAWQRALFEEIKRSGKLPMIDGYVPESIAVSSSMSSSQLHVELPFDEREAAKVFNACVLATIPVLAASGASPFFLEGREGTSEVRPQIWEKLDDLGRKRVFFGDGWIESPFEILEKYAEVERLDLKQDENEDPLTLLRRQVDSVWPHFRLIPEADHWRCENRVFSSEAPLDAIATSAFYFGLVRGLSQEMEAKDLAASVPFESVKEAFYGVCENGLDQDVPWIGVGTINAQELILDKLLPLARKGLLDSGVLLDEVETFLGVVEERVKSGRTNAQWQKCAFALAEAKTVEEKMSEVAQRYAIGVLSGLPTAQWSEWREERSLR